MRDDDEGDTQPPRVPQQGDGQTLARVSPANAKQRIKLTSTQAKRFSSFSTEKVNKKSKK